MKSKFTIEFIVETPEHFACPILYSEKVKEALELKGFDVEYVQCGDGETLYVSLKEGKGNE